MDARPLIEQGETVFELIGVSVLLIGAIIALGRFVIGALHKEPMSNLFRGLRKELARAILLGLEFLVAADIVRSVALEPSFANVGVLGLIVLVRTFLSWSLELEITGEWPWRRAQRAAATDPGQVDEL